MRELFINCSSGAAGDMLSAALVDICHDKEDMVRKLNSIGIPGIEYAFSQIEKHSITGGQMSVKYYGSEEGCDECSGIHHHHHRHITDISEIVDSLSVSGKVRNDIKNVYEIIASAESEVHGCEMEDIHFHELGTMDALADIAAVCFIINELNIDHITVSPVCTGFGEVKCAHGILPVPAPATALILKEIPVYSGDIEGELCTPTGAALIKYFADTFSNAPQMTAEAVGYGIGKKDFSRLNAVRAVLGNSEESIIELCCNVDDMTPEAVGFAIDTLLNAGAPDVYYEQIGMKKNRPGILLTCLCREDQRDEMVSLIFRHTTTIGIRETLCRRYVLSRREITEQTVYGPVRIKISEGYGTERKKAEYEDLARIARDSSLTLADVQSIIDDKFSE